LLTAQQWNLLKAMAGEKIVSKPTGKEFMAKYKFGAASSVKTALISPYDKEMIFEDKGNYRIYDVFMIRWMQKLND
jgi:hypothetical protein